MAAVAVEGMRTQDADFRIRVHILDHLSKRADTDFRIRIEQE